MPEETPDDPFCAVCERRLLPGERSIAFITSEGAEIEVCELCKPRAEAAGWLRPEEIEPAAVEAGGRDRRRPRGSQVLGGLFSRRQGSSEQRRGGHPDLGEVTGEEDAPLREPAPQADRPVARDPVDEALYAFNHTDHRRTVAGLTRTLGPPRASAVSLGTQGDDGGVRLTIAWELTWYQWEVAAGERGVEVRESGKGETIDQLRSPDRTWNLMVDADGTLQQKTSSATPVDGE